MAKYLLLTASSFYKLACVLYKIKYEWLELLKSNRALMAVVGVYAFAAVNKGRFQTRPYIFPSPFQYYTVI
jgi:hypothetical protein